MPSVPNPQAHGDCSCDFLCDGQAGCIACWVYGGGCVWQCYSSDGGPVYNPATNMVVERVVNKIGLDGRVDLRVRNAPLGEIGRLLAKLANAQIYVPADRTDEQQDLYLEDASLDAVVRELELMAIVRP